MFNPLLMITPQCYVFSCRGSRRSSLGGKMDPLAGSCPHRSFPVEMDESMTPSGADLAWLPPCQRCVGLQPDRRGLGEGVLHAPEDHRRLEPGVPALESRGVWPFGDRGPAPGRTTAQLNQPQEFSEDEVESLEPPLPLVSNINPMGCQQRVPPPELGVARGAGPRPYVHHAPPNPPPQHFNHQFQPEFRGGPHQRPVPRQQPWNPPQNPYNGGPDAAATPPWDAVHEVNVDRSLPDRGHQVTGETRRTISLPEESRKVFITYSLDTAQEMLPFTKFLSDQGFKPAIDIFDNPIRRMDITRWMDRFLKDKSVLIIVVISPQYKEDVEGQDTAVNEHGLHTKYIHNQLQDEFIQMGCRNFRLVPVLFSNATKRDVPSWLQSTRIYRWPADVQDLLLRLLREERYIMPAARGELTLTVRPL